MGRGKRKSNVVSLTTVGQSRRKNLAPLLEVEASFRTQIRALVEQIAEQSLFDLTEAEDIAQIYIDFEKKTVSLSTRRVYENGWRDGIPEIEKNGRARGLDLVRNPGDVLDMIWLRTWLTDENTLAQLDILWDGVEIEWDGSNHVGKWTFEANFASEFLKATALKYGLSREHVMGHQETIDWLTYDRQMREDDIKAALIRGQGAEGIADAMCSAVQIPRHSLPCKRSFYPDRDAVLSVVENIISDLLHKSAW